MVWYALDISLTSKFEFHRSNNKAEYEALIKKEDLYLTDEKNI